MLEQFRPIWFMMNFLVRCQMNSESAMVTYQLLLGVGVVLLVTGTISSVLMKKISPKIIFGKVVLFFIKNPQSNVVCVLAQVFGQFYLQWGVLQWTYSPIWIGRCWVLWCSLVAAQAQTLFWPSVSICFQQNIVEWQVQEKANILKGFFIRGIDIYQ